MEPDFKSRRKLAGNRGSAHGDFEASVEEGARSAAACFTSWKPGLPLGKSGIAVYMKRKIKEFGDLKVGDPKLERYGKLFSIQ